MFKKLVFLVSTVAFSQATLSLSGPATVKPNAPVTFNINLSGSTGQNISAIQFTSPFPNSSLSFAIGAAGTAASKTLFCNNITAICVIVGVNQTTFLDGVVASITWTPTQSGPFNYNLSNVNAASNAGKSLPVNVGAGASLSVTVSSPCDINGDGKIDLSDIQAFLNTFVFSTPNSTQVNPIASGNLVVDVQRIATAGIAGGSCIVGQ